MGPCLGTILRKARKNGKSRIVCIADNIQPHEKRPGDKAFTKYFIKPVDAFVTMSKKVLADLRLFTADKPASYIPHPLYDNFGKIISADEARNHLGIALTDKVVLFFGFIRQYKGLDLLLEAIALVRKSAPETSGIKFLIAGEFYENRQPYDELIRKLGIEDSLILKTDFIPDSEVKYYLCAADLVVQPYRNATQSGVTPLAYHFEVPMLVTNVGGLASMVPDGKAGLHAAPNPASIAEKIIEYFKSGKEHFLPGLKEEKKKYSWDNMVNGILELADDKS
jgi:glycosyltransferase involved in cell wall biosynthesis